MAIHVKGKSRIVHVWVSEQNVHREALRYELSSLPFYLCVSFSVYLSVCVCVSLFLLLYLALSPTPLSILFSLLICISFSTSPSLRVTISVYLSLPVFPRLSPSFSSSLTHPSAFVSVSQLYLSPLSLSLGFSAMMSFFLNIFTLKRSSF